MEYLYLVLLIAASSGQSVFSKAYSVKSNVDKQNSSLVFNFYYSALIAVFTLCIAGFRMNPSPLTWLFAAVAGITATLYNIGIVNAANSGPYPVYAITSIFGGLLAPVLLEFFVFKVRISVTGYIGTALMMLAIFLMSGAAEKSEKLSRRFILNCLLIFVSNALFGIALVLQIRLSERADGERSEFVFFAYLIAAVLSALIIVMKNRKKTLSVMKLNLLPSVFTTGAAASATLSRYMSLICIQIFGATISTPVANGGVLLVVAVLSYLIFKDKQTKIQIAGDALAIVSIILISL